MDKLFLDFFAI